MEHNRNLRTSETLSLVYLFVYFLLTDAKHPASVSQVINCFFGDMNAQFFRKKISYQSDWAIFKDLSR